MSEGSQGNTRMDDALFEDLYTRYATDVLRVSYFYLGDRQKAEDVTQDVFMKLLTTNFVQIEGKEKSWLLKVALNRCRDLWRAGWVRRVVLGAPQLEFIPDEDRVEERIERQDLLRAVHALPAQFREIILLHYYQGIEIREISEMLSLPEGTVCSRLSRARKKLEEMLREE